MPVDAQAAEEPQAGAASVFCRAAAGGEAFLLQVEVSPAFTAQQAQARLHVWETRLAEQGGSLLRPGHGAPKKGGTAWLPPTHCLVGDERNAAAAAAPVVGGRPGSGGCHIVHYSWLEGSLRKKRRLAEADFEPAALAAAAAAGTTAAAGTAAATAAASPSPSPAAIAKASAAAASAAAAGAPPPLRQLAIRSSKLTAADVQQLLLHLLAGRPRPHWLSIHGRPSTVVLAELPGLDQHLLRWEQPPAVPQLLAAAKQRVELQAVSASEVPSQTTAALLSVPPSGGGGAGKKRKHPEPSTSPAAGAAAEGATAGGSAPAAPGPPTAAQLAFPPEFYCCTPHQMRQLDYPVGCAEAAVGAAASSAADGGGSSDGGGGASLPQLAPGWVSTAQQFSSGSDEAQHEALVAVDCEMVITASGFELARVTLVDGTGRSLLDELVLPGGPVLDHNTKYSGITPEMLAGCRTSLADAQRLALKHVGPCTLLVGHTLQNDLKALKMVHGRCIDSAAIYPSPRGPPALPSLKMLAQRLLGRRIQEGAHDSHTDATCTLEAVQLKLRHGPTWATAKEGHTHLLDLLASQGRRLALVAPRETLMLHAMPAAEVVPASSDAQALEAALRLLGSGTDGDATPQQQQQQQQQQPAASAGMAGGEQPPAQQQGADQHANQQQPGGSQRQQRPPALLYLQLADYWRHLESGALQLAAQSGPFNLAAAVAAAQQDGEARRLLREADALLARLAACLPPNCLMLVLSGQGNNVLAGVLHGEGSRRKEGVEAANRRWEAAKASVAVQQLAQRAQQGALLALWTASGAG